MTRCHWLFASMPAIMALPACGTEKSASVVSNEQIYKYSNSHNTLEKLSVAESPMPIDGKTRISQKGNFRIVPATIFCVSDRHLDKIADYADLGGLYIYENLQQHGQSDKYEGVGRVFFDKCLAARDTIRISRTLSLNDKRAPYKLSWVATQGDARLVLSMQRDANDKRNWPIKLNQYSAISQVVTHDGDSLSRIMASILFGEGNK